MGAAGARVQDHELAIELAPGQSLTGDSVPKQVPRFMPQPPAAPSGEAADQDQSENSNGHQGQRRRYGEELGNGIMRERRLDRVGVPEKRRSFRFALV